MVDPIGGSHVPLIARVACSTAKSKLASRPGETHFIPAIRCHRTRCPSQARVAPCFGIGKQRGEQLSCMAMAGPHTAELTDDRAACEIKIAKCVEQLV